jgi:hypothetical protein
MGDDNRDFMRLFRKGGWAILGVLLVIVVAIMIS